MWECEELAEWPTSSLTMRIRRPGPSSVCMTWPRTCEGYLELSATSWSCLMPGQRAEARVEASTASWEGSVWQRTSSETGDVAGIWFSCDDRWIVWTRYPR